MADRSRDPTIGCFAASNLSGRPSGQASTTKRNLVARLPWASTSRLQRISLSAQSFVLKSVRFRHSANIHVRPSSLWALPGNT
jgi:hypothetical protein